MVPKLSLVDLGNHCLDRLIFVPYVVLLEFLDGFCVDSHNDGLDCHRVDHLLKGALLPLNLLVRLELEELSTLSAVLSSWVEELFFLYPLAVEVDIPGGKSHFFLAGD